MGGRMASPHPFFVLRRIYASQSKNLLLAAICFIIKSAPMWALPIATKSILDAVVNKGSHGPYYLLGTSLFYLVLILQNVPMHTLFARYMSRAVRSVQMELRKALVVQMQRLSLAFHDQSRRGALHSKILRDVDNIEMLSRQIYNTVLSGVIVMVAAVTATLLTQPVVALYFIVAVPVAVLLIRSFHSSVRERQTEFRREIEGMSAQVSEMVERIPTTRAHGLEEWEINSMQQRLERLRNSGVRLDMISEWFASSSWASFQISQFLCLLFSAWLLYKGRITVGEAMMYQGYFGMLVGSIGGILSFWPVFLAGAESMRSIGEILGESDVEITEGKLPVTAVRGDFNFQDVSFQYPSQTTLALDNLRLDVKAGECLAVVGPSGSGNSTLMNLIIGFRQPTSGRILLDGRDMMELNMREYRQFIAVVPQVTVLFSGTFRDNICYGLEHVAEEHLRRCVSMANLDEVLDQLPQGLNTPIGERGATLSGGQRQRVAIARAMLRNPRVLILDEATSALDVFSEKLVQDALIKLLLNRTTFIVAHRLSTIRHAHRILVMENGRVMECGSHDELMAMGGLYTRMHGLSEIK